jgi:hypothetical protein
MLKRYGKSKPITSRPYLKAFLTSYEKKKTNPNFNLIENKTPKIS